jgi:hypothetical protein
MLEDQQELRGTWSSNAAENAACCVVQGITRCHGKAEGVYRPSNCAYTAMTAQRPRKHALVVEVKHRLMLELS